MMSDLYIRQQMEYFILCKKSYNYTAPYLTTHATTTLQRKIGVLTRRITEQNRILRNQLTNLKNINSILLELAKDSELLSQIPAIEEYLMNMHHSMASIQAMSTQLFESYKVLLRLLDTILVNKLCYESAYRLLSLSNPDINLVTLEGEIIKQRKHLITLIKFLKVLEQYLSRISAAQLIIESHIKSQLITTTNVPRETSRNKRCKLKTFLSDESDRSVISDNSSSQTPPIAKQDVFLYGHKFMGKTDWDKIINEDNRSVKGDNSSSQTPPIDEFLYGLNLEETGWDNIISEDSSSDSEDHNKRYKMHSPFQELRKKI